MGDDIFSYNKTRGIHINTTRFALEVIWQISTQAMQPSETDRAIDKLGDSQPWSRCTRRFLVLLQQNTVDAPNVFSLMYMGERNGQNPTKPCERDTC